RIAGESASPQHDLRRLEAWANQNLRERPGVRASLLEAAAFVDRFRGDYLSDERLCRQALALRREHPGPNTSALEDSLLNLGLVLNERGAPREALPLIREAVDLRRKRLGNESGELLPALLGLAAAHIEDEQPMVALPAVQEALALSAKLGGDQ